MSEIFFFFLSSTDLGNIKVIFTPTYHIYSKFSEGVWKIRNDTSKIAVQNNVSRLFQEQTTIFSVPSISSNTCLNAPGTGYVQIIHYLHSYTIQIPVVTRKRLKITCIILLKSTHQFCQYFINDFSQFGTFFSYSDTFIKQSLVCLMQSVIWRSLMIKINK